MTTLYVVKEWETYFENNRTRELKHLSWVPLPNKQDGDGYRELVQEHKNGTAHYGVWCALLAVASKCDPRGTLLRDSRRPHDPYSLSRKTGIPSALFVEAIERLLEIGWLTVSVCQSTIPQEDAATPQEDAVTPRQNRTEQNGTEVNGTDVLADDFLTFWVEYPKKIGKKDAVKAWRAAKDKPSLEEIIEQLKAQKISAQWLRDGGRYIPNPSTWIRQGRWADELKAGRECLTHTESVYTLTKRIEAAREERARLPDRDKDMTPEQRARATELHSRIAEWKREISGG